MLLSPQGQFPSEHKRDSTSSLPTSVVLTSQEQQANILPTSTHNMVRHEES